MFRQPLLALCVFAVCLTGISLGQEAPPDRRQPRPAVVPARPPLVERELRTEASTDAAALERTTLTMQSLHEEVRRLSGPPEGKVQPLELEGQFRVTCDGAHLGHFYTNDGPTRFVAVHLLALNLTDHAIDIPRERISVLIDDAAGIPAGSEESTPNAALANAGFQYGDQHLPVQGMQGPKVWTIPARGCHGLWLAFGDIGPGSDVPPIRATIRANDQDFTLDVNQLQHAVLSRRIERVGPRNCLALYTIGGLLNTVNAGGLVEDLIALGQEPVGRVVVGWSTNAPTPDGQLLSWLQNSALRLGTGQVVSETLPAIPAVIRELHLTKLAGGRFPSNDYSGRPQAANRVHETQQQAVSAALRSLMTVLPEDELVAEIRHGHPLSRAAALEHGGSRLHEDHVPLLIALAQGDDPDLQASAVRALGNFGDPAATEQLTRWIRDGGEPRASAAIDALAASRFRASHDALRQLLASENPAVRQQVLKALAAQPRPLWVNELYQAATAPGTQPSKELLLALVQLGHPDVVDLLQQALGSEDKGLRDFAFGILSQRNDIRSERLALEFLMEQLKTTPPDGPMVQLLGRTRDPRAIPLLVRHLEGKGDRQHAITLLGQYADPAATAKMIELYPKMRTHERVLVLQALRQMEHEQFTELAREALGAKDNQLVTAAIQGLVEIGSDAACDAVIAALDKQEQPYLINALCEALGKLSQPAARNALLKERRSKEESRRDAARRGLLAWRQRSPAFVYVYQAQTQVRDKHYDDAREMFDLAVQADPELPEAWAGRGNLLFRQEKLADAEQDYEKALALDDQSSEAVTGVGIIRVMTGRVESGIELIEQRRKDFNRESLFHYNAACMYGRAMEAMDKTPDGAGRKKQYRDQAIRDLATSVRHGFEEFDWMAEDPDLKSLHGDPEFAKICRGEVEAEIDDEATPAQDR